MMIRWLQRLLRKPKPAAGPEPECGCGPDADVGPCPELTASCPLWRPLEKPEIVTMFLAPEYEDDGLCDICGVPAEVHNAVQNSGEFQAGYVHGKDKLAWEIAQIAVAPDYEPHGGFATSAVRVVLDALVDAAANPHPTITVTVDGHSGEVNCPCILCYALDRLRLDC